MFVEFHMIQNFSPSNLNRDDTNQPKDCVFGGVRRARISSQCQKRAIRQSTVFSETTGVDTGTRTRWIARLLGERLVQAGKPEDEADTVVQAVVPQYASKLDKQDAHTVVLLYLSDDEVRDLTQAMLDRWDELVSDGERDKAVQDLVKALIRVHKGHTSAPDIALFGRMLAEKPVMSLEAACQVAHAISTHRITMEMDFYTAVDDLQTKAEPGAGMVGFTGFNSACFYRYARIHWHQLVSNLRGDADLARQTVEGFLRAAVAAVPSGKQSSFAANNPPSFLLAVVRRDGMAWSLANAFERPVRAGHDAGLVGPSVTALDAYWSRLCEVYGTDTLISTAALALDSGLSFESLKESEAADLEGWLSAVIGALPAQEASR